MSTPAHRSAADNIVDQIWSTAVDRITKTGQAIAVRSGLGDGVDLAVAQAGTSALLSQVPAFDKLLYNSGYAAAARNTYLVLRRLGMPTDFFWKYEQWDDDRAFATLDKVITRIFAALLAKEGAGTLKLASADPVRSRFQLRFEQCAECAGLTSQRPMCFFHAGSFAGMLAAMLGKDFDACEETCTADGADACTFTVGERDDREVAVAFERWADGFAYTFDPYARFNASLGDGSVRPIGNLVDVGYYQMIVASAVLTNIDLIERATLDAGRRVGQQLARVVTERFGTETVSAVEGFYRRLRYASLVVTPAGGGFTVEVGEAPEHLGPLAASATVPFLGGELEGLLSTLTGVPLTLAGVATPGDKLVLTFAPQVR